ncbi:MAG: nucleoside triphosphate pyrophosphohydrolase [Selenomonadales bacterium]|nr:nucleoside triphosphate pyrophosphohydrolase [Selenomonadales bacterium]
MKNDDEQLITFVRNLGLEDEEVREIPLYELDRQPSIDHLTSVYVPRREKRATTFDTAPLEDVMATLRSPGGCPWDIEQTHDSLRRYMIEEVYEAIEAIENEDAPLLCEELGDLLLQIVFHARVAEECGEFTMQDVIDGVTEKMIRRHPHVFGDISVRDAGEVLVNWEAIKAKEKEGKRTSALDGVSPGLPALMAAFKLQKKAAKVGFDWTEVKDVWEKVREELGELAEASAEGDIKAVEEEFGDVLFSLVNLSRFLHIEPETSLTAANHKFRRRFTFIEDKVHELGKKWDDMTLAEMDKLWEQAKLEEK